MKKNRRGNKITFYDKYQNEVMLWFTLVCSWILQNDVWYGRYKQDFPKYSYLSFLGYTFALYKSSNVVYVILATLLLPFRLICCVLAPFLPIIGLTCELIVPIIFVYLIFSFAYLPEKYIDLYKEKLEEKENLNDCLEVK